MPPDPAALAELVRRHGAGLTLFARRYCSAPDDAAQLALAKFALRSEPPADPAAWLYAVCKREALQLARADRRRRHREQVAAGRWFASPEAPASGPDPEAVQAAVAGLPAAEAEAVTLHLWGGLSFAQIGEVVGTSPATAHRRYQRGLDLLRERLGGSV